jgi:hypothetical protein
MTAMEAPLLEMDSGSDTVVTSAIQVMLDR